VIKRLVTLLVAPIVMVVCDLPKLILTGSFDNWVSMRLYDWAFPDNNDNDDDACVDHIFLEAHGVHPPFGKGDNE